MPRTPTKRLRDICLRLPRAIEKETWGDPTYRVNDKIFAMEKRGDGRISVWCKSTFDVRDMLLLSAPHQFFIPPYVGSRGWIGMRIDNEPDWLVRFTGWHTGYPDASVRLLPESCRPLPWEEPVVFFLGEGAQDDDDGGRGNQGRWFQSSRSITSFGC